MENHGWECPSLEALMLSQVTLNMIYFQLCGSACEEMHGTFTSMQERESD